MSGKLPGQSAAFVAGLLAGSIAALFMASRTKAKEVVKAKDGEAGSPSQALSLESTILRQTTKDDAHRLPDEIRFEMLSRNSLYFSSSEGGMDRIAGAAVLVVGLGGVGSHAAHMLARSGVGYLRLVDFDQVTLSSLNRHAVASLEDVGLPKATVLRDHLRRICPDGSRLAIDAVVKMYTGDDAEDGALLDPPGGRKAWDVVIDAIDDVPTKANLIARCVKRGVRVLSCMGAGGKADPTRVHVSDLRSASRDPLAAAVRQRLRLMGKRDAREDGTRATNGSGVANGGWLSCIDDDSRLAVVFSSEKVVAGLAAVTDEQREGGLHNFGAVDNMRVRVLPVLGTMPAIMGQALAATALCELGGKPFSPVGAERVGRNVRHKLFQHLKSREKRFEERHRLSLREGSECYTVSGTYIGPIQIDPDDVEYLMAELWKNRCALSGDRLGTVLELYRWDRTRPAMPNNLVLMSVKSGQKFEKDYDELGDGRKGVNEEIRRRIEARLATCVLDAEEDC